MYMYIYIHIYISIFIHIHIHITPLPPAPVLIGWPWVMKFQNSKTCQYRKILYLNFLFSLLWERS